MLPQLFSSLWNFDEDARRSHPDFTRLLPHKREMKNFHGGGINVTTDHLARLFSVGVNFPVTFERREKLTHWEVVTLVN